VAARPAPPSSVFGGGRLTDRDSGEKSLEKNRGPCYDGPQGTNPDTVLQGCLAKVTKFNDPKASKLMWTLSGFAIIVTLASPGANDA
jgi:hypothetical protein